MKIRSFTRIMGFVFLLVGVLGFFPGFLHGTHPGDPDLVMNASYGRLFGLFPVNIVHNFIHIGFGVWALIASKDVLQSRKFCRANAIIYGVLAVLGIIPGLNTVFGIVPIFGHDVWLHAAIAVSTAIFGFAPVRHTRVA